VTRRRRRIVTSLAVVAGGAVAVVALVGVEVVVAGRGPILVEYEPSLADGRVDPSDPPSPSPSPSPVRAEPLRITWIGDSTAAGVGSSEADHAVSRQVARRLADELGRPIDLTVHAVSGARVADVVAGQVPLVDADADVVFISVGANDTTHLTDAGSFAEQYRALLEGLPDGAAVISLGVPDIGSVTRLAQPLRAIAGWRGGTYDAIVAEEAARAGATRVDLAAGTGPAFRADPDRLLAGDRYHPSDAGYGVWTDVIVPVAVERLRGI
jgi:lysophospholipase L1-like esterase